MRVEGADGSKAETASYNGGGHKRSRVGSGVGFNSRLLALRIVPAVLTYLKVRVGSCR